MRRRTSIAAGRTMGNIQEQAGELKHQLSLLNQEIEDLHYEVQRTSDLRVKLEAFGLTTAALFMSASDVYNGT